MAPRQLQNQPRALDLRAGEWVEVRSADEIRSTLDGGAALQGLPFMPEMLQFCGRRFRVYKTAHKTCDTIHSGVIRRMENAVHLEDLRCDGAAHGGCEAGCLFYWKEAWLKRAAAPVDAPSSPIGTRDSVLRDSNAHESWDVLVRSTRRDAAASPSELFRCQATDLLEATLEVRRRDRFNPFFYLKDVTSGNVTLFEFIKFGLIAAVNAFWLRWFGYRFPNLRGAVTGPTPGGSTEVCPGEFVRVRSRAEVLGTVNENLRNRGLSFDAAEMSPFCGTGPYKVLRRVHRLIDEKTGKMLELPNPCLILDGVTCSGMRSSNRMFCSRHLYPYWREVWLTRASAAPDTAIRSSN